jgi:hypothetical protein
MELGIGSVFEVRVQDRTTVQDQRKSNVNLSNIASNTVELYSWESEFVGNQNFTGSWGHNFVCN